MTSTPYQVVLMNIRRIYRWEDPMETGAYLGSYLFLWAIGHLVDAAVSHKPLSYGFGITLADVNPWRSLAQCGL